MYLGPPNSDFISYDPGPGVGRTAYAFGWRFPSKVPSILNFWLKLYFGPSPINDLKLYEGHFFVKEFRSIAERFDSLIFHAGLLFDKSLIL